MASDSEDDTKPVSKLSAVFKPVKDGGCMDFQRIALKAAQDIFLWQDFEDTFGPTTVDALVSRIGACYLKMKKGGMKQITPPTLHLTTYISRAVSFVVNQPIESATGQHVWSYDAFVGLILALNGNIGLFDPEYKEPPIKLNPVKWSVPVIAAYLSASESDKARGYTSLFLEVTSLIAKRRALTTSEKLDVDRALKDQADDHFLPPAVASIHSGDKRKSDADVPAAAVEAPEPSTTTVLVASNDAVDDGECVVMPLKKRRALEKEEQEAKEYRAQKELEKTRVAAEQIALKHKLHGIRDSLIKNIKAPSRRYGVIGALTTAFLETEDKIGTFDAKLNNDVGRVMNIVSSDLALLDHAHALFRSPSDLKRERELTHNRRWRVKWMMRPVKSRDFYVPRMPRRKR